MTISGHKTPSMFQRYNVTSDADQIEALNKTAVYLAAQPTKKEDEHVLEIRPRAAQASAD